MKILIISCPTGNGHNSTAKRLKEKFLQEKPDTQIEIVDMYKAYAPKITAWAMETGYFMACNHIVGIYNHFFKKSEKNTYENRYKTKANKETYSMLNGLMKKIYDFKPDLIICTYVFTAVAVNNLKRVYDIPAKVACMTLDYGVSPYWECTSDYLDYMFLTNEEMIEPFKKRGFTDEQLHIAGVPISDQFTNLMDKQQARKLLGLKEDLFTVIIMKSGFFQISEKNIVKNLSKVKKPIQVIIVNGKSEKSRKKIDKILKHTKMPHNILNIGFTNQIPEYFAASDIVLGKAGGLTVTETITAGLPALIVNKLPQQEIYNKEYCIKHKCALAADKNTIADKINYLLDNPDKYQELRENNLKTRRLGAIEKFYEVLKDVPVADYSNIPEFKDTKHQTIKKVNNARKFAIKNQQLERKSK